MKNMKTNRCLLVLFISMSLFSQSDVSTAGVLNGASLLNNSGLLHISNRAVSNSQESFYLLDDWNTKGYLVTVNDRTFLINGMNYDINNGVFVLKDDKDNILVLNDSKIKEVKIGNNKFKRYSGVPNVSSANNHIYLEVLASANNIEILKFYGLKLEQGKKDLITQVSLPDEYVNFTRIFFKKDENIQEIKLNKKQVSNLFGDRSNEIKKFISKNNMSLKEEKNLQTILNYHNTL